MDILDLLYRGADALLIFPYRLFAVPIVGFYIGTFFLCCWCVLIGEMTFRLAVCVNRAHMNRLRGDAVKMHNLSIKAIVVKDKEKYQACNKQANEAFGKYFFNMVTQGAAYLWPLPFALGWMSNRFYGVTFELPFSLPIIGDALGFAVVPVHLYILCRILWGRLKPLLPYFRHDPRVGLDEGGEGEEEMIPWEAINKHKGLPDRFWQGPESATVSEKR